MTAETENGLVDFTITEEPKTEPKTEPAPITPITRPEPAGQPPSDGLLDLAPSAAPLM